MGSETFFATAAQALPTLLIALSVELGFIGRVFQREWDRAYDERDDLGFDEGAFLMRRWRRWMAVIGCAFVVGEVLAFLAMGFRWFNVWTLVPISFCLLVMIAMVIYIPLIRHDINMNLDRDRPSAGA
jgi:hypothetical protein